MNIDQLRSDLIEELEGRGLHKIGRHGTTMKGQIFINREMLDEIITALKGELPEAGIILVEN